MVEVRAPRGLDGGALGVNRSTKSYDWRMTEWTDIERASLDVVDLVARRQGTEDLAKVDVGLSAVPPYGWIEYFRQPIGVEVPADMHPSVSQDRVSFTAPVSDLERYVEALDGVISQANRRYVTNDLPRLEGYERARQQRTQEGEDRQTRLEQLQRRAKDL